MIKTIRRLQPKAVTAIMGDDVRWVGNEKGIGRETEWSATALPPGIYSRSEELRKGLGIYGKAKDLGGRDIVARAKELSGGRPKWMCLFVRVGSIMLHRTSK